MPRWAAFLALWAPTVLPAALEYGLPPNSRGLGRRDALAQTAALGGLAIALPYAQGLHSAPSLAGAAERAAAVYCGSDLLDAVQRANIFGDSKLFVDMPCRFEPEEVLKRWSHLPQQKSPAQIRAFVAGHFDKPGLDLVRWAPTDAQESPPGLAHVQTPELQEWGDSLNRYWAQLGRATAADVTARPQRHTLLALPHPFVVPGGRFAETYYWDSYWIVQGLLVCGMAETARGMVLNALHQVREHGLVPNGARVYYLNRSQPPLLSEMVLALVDKSFDLDLVREALPLLAQEYEFWMRRGDDGHAVAVELASGEVASLNRYVTDSSTPRPEAYREDMATAMKGGRTDAERSKVYREIAAAAESGWDFSSRWLADGASLASAQTSEVLPVDLNAIMYRVETNLQRLCAIAGDTEEAMRYGAAAQRRQRAMDELMWSERDGHWLDVHHPTLAQRGGTALSGWVPLWAGAFSDHQAGLAVASLHKSGLVQRAGFVTTLARSSHQWDWPNAWAPLQQMTIEGLERTGRPDAQRLALASARRWVRTNRDAWVRTHMMFEKYDALEVGGGGGGGEYTPQVGFGWSNGVALTLLERYGDALVDGTGDPY